MRSSLLDVEDRDPEDEVRLSPELDPVLERVGWKAAGAETTSRREAGLALRETARSNLVDKRGLVGSDRLFTEELLEEKEELVPERGAITGEE